jgi:hypothetical protein
MTTRNPAEHKSKRPRPCNAERCWCKWLLFHMNRSNAKLRKGGAGA